MNLKLYEKEDQIIDSLLKQGIVAQEQLELISRNQFTQLENLKHSLFDKIYVLDNKKKQITILDKNFKETGRIDIPGTEKYLFNTDEWQTWGNSVTSFDFENKKVGDFFWKLEDNIGIGFSKNKAYLYNPNLEDDQYLVQLRSYIYGAVPKGKTDCLPFDMYLSSDCSLLCVSDRGAGKIHLINVNENKLLKTFIIRNPGSNKCINVSISKKKNKIFVTDNMSSNLTIIDLQSMDTESKNLSIGILGNICISPDEDNLYCLVTKPKKILKLIDLNTFHSKKEFSLKGDLFSLVGYVPYDLLVSSVDNKYVYVMTHIAEPEPFTPVITVIEADKEKAVLRFSIKDGSKPINIGFAESNPLSGHKKSKIELILKHKLADTAKIEEIQNLLEHPEINFKPDPNTFEIDQNFMNNQGGGSEKKKEVEWKIKIVPKKIDFCNITPGLDEVLFEKCKEKIKKDIDEDYRAKAEHDGTDIVEAELAAQDKTQEFELALIKKDNMIKMRLDDAIVKSRQELEWHDSTVVRLLNFYEGFNFEIAFTREEAIEMIHKKEMDDLIQTGLKTIATNCPNCDAQLLGSYTCRVCGFELPKPEDALTRKLTQIATYHPFDNIKHGHLIITDVINHKIIEIDHFRKVVWELKKDVLHSDVEVDLEEPIDAIRLKNNITLIADKETSRVFKLTNKGRIFWELNYEWNPSNILNSPVSIAAMESGNILIVDQGNHRIIEVDEDHEIVWKCGEKGVAGIGDGILNSPSCIQRTPVATNIISDTGNNRVIEVEGNKLIWQYGNENNIEGPESAGNGPNQLNRPLTAYRFDNGNTFILDSGNDRIIEVSPENEIVWEYDTKQAKDELDRPIRAHRLRTGRVLITYELKVAEVDYLTKEVFWSSSIDDLSKVGASRDIVAVKETVKKTKVFHGMANPYARHDSDNIEEKERKEKLKAIIEGKKIGMPARTGTRSPVLLTPGARVSEINFLMVDKVKSSIYRIDRKGHHLWTYGENNELSKPQYVFDNNAKTVLISDSENKRVIEVDVLSREIVWTYDNSADEKISYPRTAEFTPQGTILISDQLGSKVIEVDKNKELVWDYKNIENLKTPYYATRLNKGDTLIVDWSSHIVLEISPEGEIFWSYGISKKPGAADGFLSYPEFVQRLDNGNTLIVDTRNSRVIEVSPDKNIVWSFTGHGTTKLMSPTYANRLPDGNTVIYHSNNKQILEVDSQGKILWKYMHQDKRE